MEKSVTITLAPMTFVVEGNDEKELLENAKKAMIEQLQVKFPSLNNAINDADVLTKETAMPGTIVECDHGIGVLTAVNPKTINVTLTGNRAIHGPVHAFKKSSATFEEARSKRHDFMKPAWSEGDTAYLRHNDEIKEVVVGKTQRGKTKVWVINGGGKYFTLDERQLNVFLRDEKSDCK